MRVMDIIIKQLTRHEGSKNKPYNDTVGKLTIGVGRNLTDKGISDKEIDFLLQNDVEEAANEMYAAFPWMRELSTNRQIVFINMVFNMGLPRFRKFQNTIRLARIGHFEESAKEMLDSKWAVQVGNRALELSLVMASGERVTKEEGE